jgi:hypothetical protein
MPARSSTASDLLKVPHRRKEPKQGKNVMVESMILGTYEDRHSAFINDIDYLLYTYFSQTEYSQYSTKRRCLCHPP